MTSTPHAAPSPHPFAGAAIPGPDDAAEDTRPTATEVLQSLTGYDEIAVEKAFGSPITTLANINRSTFGRALVFAIRLHAGDKHEPAKTYAMGLTIGEIDDHFADDDDDELPGSESGKDGD